MSSISKNKEELISSIENSYENLFADYMGVPKELSREIGVEGNVKNTEISVSDTISYLIGWGNLVLKWHELRANNLEVDFPEKGYRWNELGRLAQHFHASYKDWSYKQLLTEFQFTTQKILKLVDSLSNDELYGHSWYKSYTLGRMIQFNTSSPMKNIRTKVRRFKKQNNIK